MIGTKKHDEVYKLLKNSYYLPTTPDLKLEEKLFTIVGADYMQYAIGEILNKYWKKYPCDPNNPQTKTDQANVDHSVHYLDQAHVDQAHFNQAHFDQAHVDQAKANVDHSMHYLDQAKADQAHVDQAHFNQAHVDQAHLYQAKANVDHSMHYLDQAKADQAHVD
ncbi:hypothetical protein H4S02_006278 [Coemansia sp. RSA 2611]|nr:hypothetical protein H4S02_006278 [Coemansia sp. RSA 2611]